MGNDQERDADLLYRINRENKFRKLYKGFILSGANWTDHKYEIDLSPDKLSFKRDGVDWDEVTDIKIDMDLANNMPKLIIECLADIDNEMFASDWAEAQDTLPKYKIVNHKGSDELEVYRDDELIEEVQAVEIKRGASMARITHIVLTVIADVDLRWDYSDDRYNLERAAYTGAIERAEGHTKEFMQDKLKEFDEQHEQSKDNK